MAWGKKQTGLPEAVAAAAAAGATNGDRLVAAAHDDLADQWVLAGRTHLRVVGPDGTERLARPWLDVDAGSWDPETDVLAVTWVDDGEPAQWRLTGPTARTFTEAFRDRVQASVVLIREVDLGRGRTTRVAVRKDLATRELLDQVVPGPGVRALDSELAREVAVARATLRDQSGLPPLGA